MLSQVLQLSLFPQKELGSSRRRKNKGNNSTSDCLPLVAVFATLVLGKENFRYGQEDDLTINPSKPGRIRNGVVTFPSSTLSYHDWSIGHPWQSQGHFNKEDKQVGIQNCCRGSLRYGSLVVCRSFLGHSSTATSLSDPKLLLKESQLTGCQPISEKTTFAQPFNLKFLLSMQADYEFYTVHELSS